MLDEISYNVADSIPFKSFKEKIKLVNQELNKNRHVEVWDELKVIYSAEKWERKENSNEFHEINSYNAEI